MAGDENMTASEVAAFLRVSTRTVYRYMDAGKLAGAKVGGKWLFKSEDVRRLTDVKQGAQE